MLSFAYLVALRGGYFTPSFLPLMGLAVFPIASALVGSGGGEVRGRRRALLGIALLELLWTVLAEALVGFAIAWRSG
jgi:hypothetical protein